MNNNENKFTTESAINPADVSEVIDHDIPTKIKSSEDTINENATDKKPSGKLADQIDAVLDVVNNAKPISDTVPADAKQPINEDKTPLHCKHRITGEHKPIKKDKRKKKAKIMLGTVCGIAVYCINIVFALLMIGFFAPMMSDIVSKIITATFSSIVTVGGIAVYNYIARTINH